jgi:uncharacterized protein (TIGR02466 family)
MQTIDVVPLFSKPLFQTYMNLTEEESLSLTSFYENEEYEKSSNKRNALSVSKNKKILNKKELFTIKNKLLTTFTSIKNHFLSIKNNFVITTSWLVKAEMNENSEYHSHTNCLFSGVYYHKVPLYTSALSFKNSNIELISVEKEKMNPLNSDGWQVFPKRDLLIFFPSSLEHKVEQVDNLSYTRYSLAFNLMPTGELGMNDSSLKIVINE